VPFSNRGYYGGNCATERARKQRTEAGATCGKFAISNDANMNYSDRRRRVATVNLKKTVGLVECVNVKWEVLVQNIAELDSLNFATIGILS
jgi:hypothetical protein